MSIVDEDVEMSEARVGPESGQASNDESEQVLINFFLIFTELEPFLLIKFFRMWLTERLNKIK